MMRFATLAGTLAVLLGGAALAAPGDALVVSGDVVNLRAGPGTDAAVLRRVHRDDSAIELARQDNWVQVRLADQTIGWIHGSLVAALASAPAPAAPVAGAQPGAAPAPAQPDPMAAVADPTTAAALAQFRATVSGLNDRALAAAGVDLFTDVQAVGEGTVQVTATDAWRVVPEGGRQSYMNALFGHWQAAAGGGQPLRLQLVDRTGQVLMERSGP